MFLKQYKTIYILTTSHSFDNLIQTSWYKELNWNLNPNKMFTVQLLSYSITSWPSK